MALVLALAIIAFAAAFHAHWALGGQLGLSVSLPQRADGARDGASAGIVTARSGRSGAGPDLPCLVAAGMGRTFAAAAAALRIGGAMQHEERQPAIEMGAPRLAEAIGRDGYIIAQAYVPAAKKGDIRLFLMNGLPLQIGGKYAAPRRVAAADDIRPNIRHVPGRGRHRRRQDIGGERVLAGQSGTLFEAGGVDFTVPILEALERKVAIAAQYESAFRNRHLAIL